MTKESISIEDDFIIVLSKSREKPLSDSEVYEYGDSDSYSYNQMISEIGLALMFDIPLFELFDDRRYQKTFNRLENTLLQHKKIDIKKSILYKDTDGVSNLSFFHIKDILIIDKHYNTVFNLKNKDTIKIKEMKAFNPSVMHKAKTIIINGIEYSSLQMFGDNSKFLNIMCDTTIREVKYTDSHKISKSRKRV